MSFTPLQIAVTFISFFIAVFMAYWWHNVDKNAEKKLSDRESFPVLMSVFFWSAFFALALKMIIDLGVFYIPNIMVETSVYYGTLFMEEFVKAAALIIGLVIAGKRFNELSDGVMYAVFAALGFIFFENIFYLLSESPSVADFFIILMSRNIFAFTAHLSIVLFGLFYAAVYLHTSKKLLNKLKKRKEHRVQPYHIHRLFYFLWQKYSIGIVLWLPLAPFHLLWKISKKEYAHLTMSELLVGGFLMSVYIHIAYDVIIDMNINWLNSLMFAVFGIIGVFLFYFFPKIDEIN